MTERVNLAILRAIEQIELHEADYQTALRATIHEIAALGQTITPEDGREIRARLPRNVFLRNSWTIYNSACAPDILKKYPAQELIFNPRLTEFKEEIEWQERWCTAGGKLLGGRMIALKSDLVWQLMSDFGYPFPPFAAASLMDLRPVARDEAVQLGLLDRHEIVELQTIERPTAII